MQVSREEYRQIYVCVSGAYKRSFRHVYRERLREESSPRTRERKRKTTEGAPEPRIEERGSGRGIVDCLSSVDGLCLAVECVLRG